MPRHRRLDLPGAVYHVITRGIERREIFKDSDDRKEFIDRLANGVKEVGCKCYGWALMPNHFHLLIRMNNRPLSDLMRKLLTGYAIYFNRRYKRSGYLYQNRYKSVLCQEDAYLLELVRYIHLNPLRAKLVNTIDALRKYPWSGHAVLMGTITTDFQDTDEVLSRFGHKRSEAVKRYESFVRDGIAMGKRTDLTGGGLRRSAGGWHAVMELRRSKEYWRADERILGDGDFVTAALKTSDEQLERREKLKRDGWDIEKVVERVCKVMLLNKKHLFRRSRRNTVSHGRELLVYWCSRELGVSGKGLADYLGVSKVAISKSIRRGQQYAEDHNIKFIS